MHNLKTEMMKKLIYFVLLAINLPSAKAQNNHVVKDSVIAKFNRGELKGIYTMAGARFQKDVTEGQLVSLLQGAASLGKILSDQFLGTDTDSVSSYKLVFPKKSLLLTIRSTSPSAYDNFGLSFYKLPVVRSRQKFLSDNLLKSKLDSTLQDAVALYMSNKNVAGLSIGVLRNGQMHEYNFGETKKGSGQLPTAGTIYEIGSITKTFTGILLAEAVLQGKVKLDDDIRKYLPGKYPNLEFAGRAIQLVHLSNHTSRLPSQPKPPGAVDDIFSPSVKFTDKMLDDVLQQIVLDTLPGTRREYSNFAVGLLGIILEKVYGLEYERLLQKYIFNTYAMKQTKIGLSNADFKSFSQGYDVEGNPAPYWRNRIAEPGGGIRSTTRDMLLYMSRQLDKGNAVTKLSHTVTFGDTKRGTGLNWGISTTKEGHLRWSHDDGTDGFTSLCLIYPELNSGIILLTNNGDHDDQSFYEIAKSIYSSWLK